MLRKALIGFMLAVLLLWFLVGAAPHLVDYYNLPRVPDRNTGNIYRVVVNHGSVRLGTESGVHTLWLMQKGLPAACLAGPAALRPGLRLGLFQVRGVEPPK
jgi:hypothetical protein